MDHPEGSEMMKHYDIRFHAANGKSDEFYSFLEKEGASVKCIVICTGSAAENREIFEDLTGWFGPGRPIPMILEASRGRYACIDEDRRASSCLNLYESDVLEIERIDAMAMQIHHMYCQGSGRTAAEDWEASFTFRVMVLSTMVSAPIRAVTVARYVPGRYSVMTPPWRNEKLVVDPSLATQAWPTRR